MTGINRQPPGLSDLLQVQSGGRNPDDFSQMVRGTMDLAPYYEVGRLRATVEPYSLSVGQREFIEVPEGEVWLMQFLSGTVDNMVTANWDATFSFGLERIIGQGLNGVELMGPFRPIADASDANNLIVFGGQLPRPFIVTGGQRLTLLLNSEGMAIANVDGEFNAVYTLLNV